MKDTKAPRITDSKFNSQCAETGNPIKKGESCLYVPAEKKVYAMSSKTAQDFKEDKVDEMNELLSNQPLM